MGRDVLGNLGPLGCGLDRFLDRGWCVGTIGCLARKETRRRSIRFPIRPQLPQQSWREWNDSFLVALATDDAELHSMTVDIDDFQSSRFGKP